MEKSLQQTVEERRAYVNQIRSSFQTDNSVTGHSAFYGTMREQEENTIAASTLGIRTVIAILIFAAFVYCDKENITYHNYSTKEVFSQIEWNPLPMEEIEEYVQSR